MLNTEIILNQRIGDIVTENYHAAGVFKNYGIDFCCGGGKSLNEVCEKNGISADEVLNSLVQLPQGQTTGELNFKDWNAGFLIDYIINIHHSFVRNKIDEIAGYAAKVARVHGAYYPENVDIYRAFVSLSKELLEHLEAEESTVFPLIKKLADKKSKGVKLTSIEIRELKKQLALMVDDHDGAGELMATIRKLSNDFTPPADACRTYQILYQNLAGFEEDLHKHVHLENNILFKKAESLLPA